jgi:hypothetical protein
VQNAMLCIYIKNPMYFANTRGIFIISPHRNYYDRDLAIRATKSFHGTEKLEYSLCTGNEKLENKAKFIEKAECTIST